MCAPIFLLQHCFLAPSSSEKTSCAACSRSRPRACAEHSWWFIRVDQSVFPDCHLNFSTLKPAGQGQAAAPAKPAAQPAAAATAGAAGASAQKEEKPQQAPAMRVGASPCMNFSVLRLPARYLAWAPTHLTRRSCLPPLRSQPQAPPAQQMNQAQALRGWCVPPPSLHLCASAPSVLS